MLTLELYTRIKRELVRRGHEEDYLWSESLRPCPNATELALEYTWVVLNSGMKNTVARGIMERMRPVLFAGQSASTVFGHKGKAAAIDEFWREREWYYAKYKALGVTGNAACDGDATASAVLEWCESLRWIGPITRYHLAKNLGVDCAKPDRWLVRLADAECECVDGLCARLAQASGDRVATVDVVLWRACAIGVLTVKDGVIEAPGLEES